MTEATKLVDGKKYLIEIHGEFEVARWTGTYFVNEDIVFSPPNKVYMLPYHRKITLEEAPLLIGQTYLVLEPKDIYFGEYHQDGFITNMDSEMHEKDNQVAFRLPKWEDIV
jgi:NAD-dependent SIR2 family protein deacetylase